MHHQECSPAGDPLFPNGLLLQRKIAEQDIDLALRFNSTGAIENGPSIHVFPYLRVFFPSSEKPAGSAWEQLQVAEKEPRPRREQPGQRKSPLLKKKRRLMKRAPQGWWRFFRADQVIEWLLQVFTIENGVDVQGFSSSLRSLLRNAQIPVEDYRLDHGRALADRVETIRVGWKEFADAYGCKKRRKLVWSRSSQKFPMGLRSDPLPGLDLVHTPENERSGLTRYLARGWTIDDQGRLVASEARQPFPQGGTLFEAIPYQFHNVPRRLMLATSLISRAVGLAKSELPCEPTDCMEAPPARRLRAIFRTFGGHNHEDAFIVSESAAAKLHSQLTYRVGCKVASEFYVNPDTHVARKGAAVPAHKPLLLAEIDPYAIDIQAASDQQVLFRAPYDCTVDDVWCQMLNTSRYHSWYVFRLRTGRPLRVGDKLSTLFGIKGIVSAILPDNEMPKMADDSPAEIVLSPLGIVRRGALGQLREAAGGAPALGAPGRPLREGRIFVCRQPQDAEPRCRVVGAVAPRGQRGQRCGEMEFAALMAHGAESIAAELLSARRSLDPWSARERWHDRLTRPQASQQALNRFLALVGASIDGGRIVREVPPDQEFDEESASSLVLLFLLRLLFPTERKTVENPAPPRRTRRVREIADTIVVSPREGLRCLDRHKAPTEIKAIRHNLSSVDWFSEQRHVSVVLPRATTIEIDVGSKKSSHWIALRFDAVPILPPWLRPDTLHRKNPITEAYRKLLCAITQQLSAGKRKKRVAKKPPGDGAKPVGPTQRIKVQLARIVSLAGDRYSTKAIGAGTFLRREVLGRRLNHSARAVIVPRPDLDVDQVAISESVADVLFQGLDERFRELVLLFRNPTLHRRGLVAVRPKIEPGDSCVFGLPLGLLGSLAADFDGDQATLVALTTDGALAEAESLRPGWSSVAGQDASQRGVPRRDLREDPFRPGRLAFAPIKELALSEPMAASLATKSRLSDDIWRKAYSRRLAKQIKRVDDAGGGWDTPTIEESYRQYIRYWTGWDRAEWLGDFEHHEQMKSVAEQVPRKGRFGGIYRNQLYALTFSADAQARGRFWKAVEALGALTERVTQSALTVKHGAGAVPFREKAFFRNLTGATLPADDQRRTMLAQIDQANPVDADLLIPALGRVQSPENLLAWMQHPRLKTLLKVVSSAPARGSHQEEAPRDTCSSWVLAKMAHLACLTLAASPRDPRWAWYLANLADGVAAADSGAVSDPPTSDYRPAGVSPAHWA